MRHIWKVLLFLIPALLIVLIALVALFRTGTFAQYVRQTTRLQLERATGRRVQARQVRVGRDQIIIEGLTIRERDGRQVWLRIPRVVVRYDAGQALLRPGSMVQAVREVRLQRPELFLRRNRQGVWNVADLLARPPTAARFRGLVVASGGTVTLVDDRPPRGFASPQVNSFRQLALTAFVLPSGRIHLSAAARGPVGRLDSLRLAASSGGDLPALATLTASSSNLAYVLRYLQPGSTVQVSSGQAGVQATMIAAGAREQPLVVARARLAGVSLRTPDLPRPLRNTSGQVLLAGRDVWLRDVRTQVGGSPLAASGLVANYARPRLALAVASARLAPAELAALLPAELRVGGPVAVQVRLEGPVDRLQARGQAQVGSLMLGGMRLRPVSARFAYCPQAIYLDHLRAGLASGALIGEAWVNLPPRGAASGALVGTARQVPFSALHQVVPRSITGTASGPIALAYRGETRLVASLELRQGRVATLAYRRGQGQLAYEGGILRLPYVRLDTDLAQVAAKGTISGSGALDLQVAASQVSVARLARQVGERRVWGLGFVAGRLTGTAENPVFVGQAQAVNVTAVGRRIHLVTASLTANREWVDIESGVAFYRGAEVTVSGRVGLPGKAGEPAPLNLELAVRRASLASLLALAEVEGEAQGSVQADIRIQGTLERPRVVGEVAAFAPVIAGQLFDEGALYFTYQGGVLAVQDARLLANDSVIAAAGTVSEQGAIDITLSSERLNLSRLALPGLRQWALNLSGELALSGRITGTRRQPQAVVTLSSPQLRAAGQAFTDLGAELRWQPGAVEVVSASVRQGEAAYALRGTIDTEGHTLALLAQVDQASMAAWRQVLEDRRASFEPDSLLRKFAEQLAKMPRPLNGLVSGEASIGGTFDLPAAEVSFNVTAATLAQAALPQVQGKLTFSREAVRISELVARQDTSYATVTGTVEAAGPLNLDVDAFNLNARLFEPWIKLPVQGSADITSVIRGTLSDPQLIGSVEITGVQGAGITLDSVRVDRFTLDARRLVLEEVVMTQGPRRAVFTASLPVSISPFDLVRDQPLRISADVTNQDLALVATVVPGISEARGPLNGHLVITGTAEELVFDGFLTVADGTMRVEGLARPVTNLEVKLTLAGQTLTIEELSAAVGPGRVSGTGTALLTTLDPEQLERNRYDITLTTRAVPLSVPRVLEARTDADLHLTNEAGQDGLAVLRGEIRLSEMTVAVPPTGQVQAALVLPLFRAGLDVAVVAVEDVWLRTPAANIQLTGSGHLGGTFTSPTASATLESRRGTLTFPGARFQISYAAIDIFVPPPQAPEGGGPPVFSPRLNLQAEGQATVQGYRVFLTVAGPIDNLQPRLRSIPDLPQSELYALVVGVGRTPGAFGEETRQLLTAGLGSVVARPIEELFMLGLGLAEFSVEFGVAEPIRVRVGQYLVDRLYLSYLRSVTGAMPTWTVRTTYEITPTFWLGFSVTERRERRFELQNIIRF